MARICMSREQTGARIEEVCINFNQSDISYHDVMNCGNVWASIASAIEESFSGKLL